MTSAPVLEMEAQTPCGLNHLVLNVRDIEESHRFWTELLGFRQVGTSRFVDPHGNPPMRFYSGRRDGKLRHHDIALVQGGAPPASPDRQPQAFNHVAVEYATLEAWQKQIEFLTGRGVALHRWVERGVTHSINVTDPNGYEIELVYELPRSHWEGDIDAALNQAVRRDVAGQGRA